MHGHMYWAITIFAFLLLAVALIAYFLFRPAVARRHAAARLLHAHPNLLAQDNSAEARADYDDASMRDTIFILPDISHYTRFMTGSEFSFAHAQHVIFALINSMIIAASRTVELSKLEGDAALFFVDADRHPPERIGQCVLDIFAAFYAEQARLIETNMCACRACQSIQDLDLKVFVHRGEAARFEFRGSVDHFGVDMIVLHRLMKNSAKADRYVMVTDAARSLVAFPVAMPSAPIEEDLRGYGRVTGRVFALDDDLAATLAAAPPVGPTPSRWRETCLKLRANLESIGETLSRKERRGRQ